jgi:hypothetical protein
MQVITPLSMHVSRKRRRSHAAIEDSSVLKLYQELVLYQKDEIIFRGPLEL